MSARKPLVLALACALLVGVVCLRRAQADDASAAVDAPVRMVDTSVAHVFSGASTIDVSAAVYTSYQPLVTIECNQAMEDVQITFDLDAGDSLTNSFADTYTSETITFICAYKIQGNWRLDEQSDTATVTGTAAEGCCVTLRPGIVGPVEDLRIYVKVSTEQVDVCLPYLLKYKGQGVATVTNVSN